MVTINLAPLLHVYLSLHGQAPQISPVTPVRGDPSGPSGKHPAVLGSWIFTLGSFLSPPLTPPKSYRPRGHLMWPCNYPENGRCSWSVDILLTFVMLFLLGLCRSTGVLPPHPLGSGMFTIVTCLSTYLVRGVTLGTTYLAILIRDFLIFSSDC